MSPDLTPLLTLLGQVPHLAHVAVWGLSAAAGAGAGSEGQVTGDTRACVYFVETYVSVCSQIPSCTSWKVG